MTRPDSYTPVSDKWPDYMETEGRANRVGAKAIAVPGNLMAWCEIAEPASEARSADADGAGHSSRGARL